MRLLYVFHTRDGDFYIGEQDGRFHPVYESDSLGSYAHPWQAAEDLASGHTSSIPSLPDIDALGIPEDLGEWEKLP